MAPPLHPAAKTPPHVSTVRAPRPRSPSPACGPKNTNRLLARGAANRAHEPITAVPVHGRSSYAVRTLTEWGATEAEWGDGACGASADLEWKLTYVGSAEDEKYDQVLDSVLVGPVVPGSYRFVFQADPPDPSKIPSSDVVGVTVLLLTCSYRDKEFIRVGYYVNTEYESEELRETPPEPVQLDKCVRLRLASQSSLSLARVVCSPPVLLHSRLGSRSGAHRRRAPGTPIGWSRATCSSTSGLQDASTPTPSVVSTRRFHKTQTTMRSTITSE